MDNPSGNGICGWEIGGVRKAEDGKETGNREDYSIARDIGSTDAMGCGVADMSVHGHATADGLRETSESSEQTGANGKRKLAGSGDAEQLADAANHGRDERMPGAGGSFGQGECWRLRESAGEGDGCGVAENANGRGCGRRHDGDQAGSGRQIQTAGLGGGCGVADGDRKQCDGSWHAGENRRGEFADGGECCGISDAKCARLERLRGGAGESGESKPRNFCGSRLPPWQRSAFIYCRDHKIRRVPAESLLLGVADGVSGKLDGGGVEGISETGGFPLTTQKEGRAMILKGYGNAIVP